MSKITKKILMIVFMGSFYLLSAQNDGRKLVAICINDLNDIALKEYSISKDTTSAHFSIYIKGFESKKIRDKAIKEYYDDPGRSLDEPTFVITFYSSLSDPVFKPKRIKSLKGIHYITLKEFRDSNYPQSSPTYIIHKLKDGTYLKWETNILEIL